MSKNREQSAIDAIYEMVEKLDIVLKKIDVMDQNIKLLNNKVKKIQDMQGSVEDNRQNTIKPLAKNINQAPVAVVPGSNKLVKLFGKVKNQRKKPIKGVYVKIYDIKGTLLKSRETDDEGYWEARVEPGEYGVELNASHINPKFRPINKVAVIEEQMNEYEVK